MIDLPMLTDAVVTRQNLEVPRLKNEVEATGDVLRETILRLALAPGAPPVSWKSSRRIEGSRLACQPCLCSRSMPSLSRCARQPGVKPHWLGLAASVCDRVPGPGPGPAALARRQLAS